jgi:hypothetical protein
VRLILFLLLLLVVAVEVAKELPLLISQVEVVAEERLFMG